MKKGFVDLFFSFFCNKTKEIAEGNISELFTINDLYNI
jgi:hypothetical protein